MEDFSKYTKRIADARKDIISGKSVDAIIKKGTVLEAVGVVLQNYSLLNDIELEEFLYLCNDIYNYSEEGLVAISDRAYDEVMNYHISRGNKRIIYPDTIKSGSWSLITHEDPGIVGSLKKCYDKWEFLSYLTGESVNELSEGLKADTLYDNYIIAPKYDGISGSIKIKNGKIEYVATRRDGNKGQNITELFSKYDGDMLIARMQATFWVMTQIIYPDLNLTIEDLDNGFYKVEFLMSTDAFEKLIKLPGVKYANRRSAVAGIVNSPKNIEYGKYLTVMPLLFKPLNENRIIYATRFAKRLEKYTPEGIFSQVIELLEHIRSSSFIYRVDGVVCFPDYPDDLNMADYMDNAMAFKINTAENKTEIIDGYVSVGILGKAVPMLHVNPVEVNETTVTDVSLGSWDKFLSMDLHEGEMIEIFSAGDVIPQARVPKNRVYSKGSGPLKISRICPHCGDKLKQLKNEYWCMNDKCPRIRTGRIVNFVRKIGGTDIDEGIIEELYNCQIIEDIEDLFTKAVKRLQVEALKGWGARSISNLNNELRRLMSDPIPISTFIGALGIKGIARKKCRKIFKNVDLNWIIEHDPVEVNCELCGIDGIGPATAEIFTDFIKENKKEIKRLMKLFLLTEDKKYKGAVVFTGFRDEDLAEQFDSIGYEVVDTVTTDTVLLINGSKDNNSAKCKSALKKGIDIIHRLQADEAIKYMNKE